MKSIINNYYKDFLLRGMISMGFGPIVWVIIYAALGFSKIVYTVSVLEMCIGVLSIAALAFISGAITVLYQIEEIPLVWSILAHGIVLYSVYAMVYIFNGWLEPGIIPFIVFTAIFVLGYFVIWGIIYLVTKRHTDKISKIISKNG